MAPVLTIDSDGKETDSKEEGKEDQPEICSESSGVVRLALSAMDHNLREKRRTRETARRVTKNLAKNSP